MRVLVHPSDYVFLNAGDTAMMGVAINRLLAHLPDAHFDVLTERPDLLPDYGPRVTPLSDDGRVRWSTGISGECGGDRDAWAQSSDPFVRLMRDVDAFVVTGMGGITDAFPDYARILLNTIELAQVCGVPTFLFGQGLGPLDDELTVQSRRVLANVDYLGLREGLHGPRLLEEWNVDPARWSVTGDDALELARRTVRPGWAGAIGFNVRVAYYSGVTADRLATIGDVVRDFAERESVRVRVVPISRLEGEQDETFTRRALSEDWRIESAGTVVDSASAVIDHISGCRVVVTGSYHAGVFALAQGIPVIGLAQCDYYRWKFSGLAHQFPEGCVAVDLETANAASTLSIELQRLWKLAPSIRQRLQFLADEQITASRSVYRHACAFMTSKRTSVWF